MVDLASRDAGTALSAGANPLTIGPRTNRGLGRDSKQ